MSIHVNLGTASKAFFVVKSFKTSERGLIEVVRTFLVKSSLVVGMVHDNVHFEVPNLFHTGADGVDEGVVSLGRVITVNKTNIRVKLESNQCNRLLRSHDGSKYLSKVLSRIDHGDKLVGFHGTATVEVLVHLDVEIPSHLGTVPEVL